MRLLLSTAGVVGCLTCPSATVYHQAPVPDDPSRWGGESVYGAMDPHYRNPYVGRHVRVPKYVYASAALPHRVLVAKVSRTAKVPLPKPRPSIAKLHGKPIKVARHDKAIQLYR